MIDVTARLQSVLPLGLQGRLAPAYRAIRRKVALVDRVLDRRTLTLSEFEALLFTLGVRKDAVVFLHSSLDAIARRVPGLSPIRLIRILQNLLTESGALLMPAFPFTGRQARYADRVHIFDVQRTPSQTGLVTEVFRRLPGVSRSLHPTHSVAAWGRCGRELVATHHMGGAFGPNSPIYKLRDVNGLVIGIGTRFRESFTIMHVPEEIHPKAQARLFESKVRSMTIVNGGSRMEYTFRALRPDVRRNYARVERILEQEGVLRNITVGGLHCVATHAERFIDRALQLVDEDRYL